MRRLSLLLVILLIFPLTVVAKNYNQTFATVGFFYNSTTAKNEPLSYLTHDFGYNWKPSIILPLATSEDTQLVAIDCDAKGHCSAIGNQTGTYTDPVTYYSDNFGETWSLPVYPPSVSGFNTELFGLSCLPTRRCISVGSYYNKIASAVEPLVYTSNYFGKSWNIAAGLPLRPSATSEVTRLNAVDCVKGKICLAAGEFTENADDGVFNPIAYVSYDNGEHWSSQLLTPAPFPEYYTHHLASINCQSKGNCVVVGFARSDFIKPVSYSTTDFGKTWVGPIFPTYMGSSHSELLGVTCNKKGRCISVGYYFKDKSGMTEPLTYISKDFGLHWMLSFKQPEPPLGATQSGLHSIACKTLSRCVAVGFYKDSSGKEKPLTYVSIDYGNRWSSPIFPGALGGGNNQLIGVASGY